MSLLWYRNCYSLCLQYYFNIDCLSVKVIRIFLLSTYLLDILSNLAVNKNGKYSKFCLLLYTQYIPDIVVRVKKDYVHVQCGCSTRNTHKGYMYMYSRSFKTLQSCIYCTFKLTLHINLLIVHVHSEKDLVSGTTIQFNN